MTCNLVAKFKMDQMDVEDLEQMAADISRVEGVLGGENVWRA
jgi:hypothetical protein